MSASIDLTSSARRLASSSLLASRVSWLSVSSTSQSCHSPSPSILSGAFSEWSGAARRRFICTTSFSGTFRVSAILVTCSGARSPSSMACIWPLSLRRLKNSFFCAAVVPIFTSDQERRMYSWIEARIHHMA